MYTAAQEASSSPAAGPRFWERELRRVVKEKVGKKAAFPGFIKPALAEQLSRPPKGEGWIHEAKFDGYRVQVHIANDAVKVFTRRGYDWTLQEDRDGRVAYQCALAIIDGEVVVPAADGVSDFSMLQQEIKAKRSDKLVLYALICFISTATTCAPCPLRIAKNGFAA